MVPTSPEQKEIPFARVNHNKYMVTDKIAYIGNGPRTLNVNDMCTYTWSPGGKRAERAKPCVCLCPQGRLTGQVTTL